MKRWIPLLLALLFLGIPALPSTAQAAPQEVCACFTGDPTDPPFHCDMSFGSTYPSYVACGSFCTTTNGTRHVSHAWDGDSISSTGLNVISSCAASEQQADAEDAANAAAGAAAAAALTPSYPTPILNVDIPGVSFSQPILSGGYLSSNFLGVYVSGVYTFLIGFSLTIAIVMLMIGGVQYVIGAGTGDAKKAKGRIQNAIVGFVLLLFVYVILYTVNPQLTVFNSLTVEVVPPAPQETEDDAVSGTVATSFGTPTGSNVTGKGKAQVPADLVANIDAAATAMLGQAYGISITSSFRSVEKQRELIFTNCQNPPGSNTCNPKPNHPTTCILKDNNPANCPHTTGHALDVWGTQNGSQCVTQDACMADMAACRANACQAALITAMRAAGFCNLASEPWHFEKPKMSSTCN